MTSSRIERETSSRDARATTGRTRCDLPVTGDSSGGVNARWNCAGRDRFAMTSWRLVRRSRCRTGSTTSSSPRRAGRRGVRAWLLAEFRPALAVFTVADDYGDGSLIVAVWRARSSCE